MEKYLKFVPGAMLVAYLVKIELAPASLADAGIIFSLACLTAFYEYRLKDKHLVNMRFELASQSAQLEEIKVKMKGLEGNMSGLRLGLGARTMTNVKG